jgi:O-methyltransferase involved in polyketide biosynthesis
MNQNPNVKLDDIPETMLATLYIRALETQRPDALLKDDKAMELVARLGPALERIKRIHMDEDDRVTIVLRNREIDRLARDFISRGPSVVVHLGCGLDARFNRVDDGRVEWFDLDVPEAIELRRRLLEPEEPRYHLKTGSAFDIQWFDALAPFKGRALLVIAEGVFQYFHEQEVRSLVVALCKRFPGAELVFDAFSPFIVHADNLRMRLARLSVRYHWGLRDGKLLEGWSDGIRLMEEWFPFSRPEPRLARIQWMRNIPFLARVIGVYHYRLG